MKPTTLIDCVTVGLLALAASVAVHPLAQFVKAALQAGEMVQPCHAYPHQLVFKTAEDDPGAGEK